MAIPSKDQRMFTSVHGKFLKHGYAPWEYLMVTSCGPELKELQVHPYGVVDMPTLGRIVSHSFLYFNIVQAIVNASEEELPEIIESLRLEAQ